MKAVSREQALDRIMSEFSRRGWRRQLGIAVDLIRNGIDGDGALNVKRITRAIPTSFLEANATNRVAAQHAVEAALAGFRVSTVASTDLHVTNHIAGSAQLILGGNGTVNTKNITINNQGQFAGNIDSSDSEVKVDYQQQALIGTTEGRLKHYSQDQEVQRLLSLPIPADDKTKRIGAKLAKLSGLALDVATDFAAKLVAEMVRPS